MADKNVLKLKDEKIRTEARNLVGLRGYGT